MRSVILVHKGHKHRFILHDGTTCAGKFVCKSTSYLQLD